MAHSSGFAHLANTSLWPAVSPNGWSQQPQQQPKPTPVFTNTSGQRVTSQVVPTDYQPPQGFQSGPQVSNWMQAKQQQQQQPRGGRKSSKKYKSRKSKKSKKSKSRRRK